MGVRHYKHETACSERHFRMTYEAKCKYCDCGCDCYQELGTTLVCCTCIKCGCELEAPVDFWIIWHDGHNIDESCDCGVLNDPIFIDKIQAYSALEAVIAAYERANKSLGLGYDDIIPFSKDVNNWVKVAAATYVLDTQDGAVVYMYPIQAKRARMS